MATNDRTLSDILRMRLELDRYVSAADRELARMWGTAWQEVAEEVESAAAELVKVASEDPDGWPRRAAVLRSQRARNALKATTEAVRDLSERSGAVITGDTRRILDSAEHWTRLVAQTQMPPGVSLSWSRVSPDALDAMVKRTTQRVHALTWPLTAQAEAQMKSVLIRGVAVGDNPRVSARQIVQRAQGAFNGGLARARTIASTELQDVHREAARRSRVANGDVLKGWRWHCTLSNRTCPACISMNGTTYGIDEPGPLGHQNCLLPGAIVSGPRAEASTSRWFEGEVIDLYTVSGSHLAVTPNHPILTSDGWVAAGLLHEGGDVISSRVTQRPAVGDVPDDHQIPALVEDVAQSLGSAALVDSVRVPTSPEDFHGDGSGSQVHVVRADGLLRRDPHAPRLEHADNCALAIRYVGLARLACLSTSDLAHHAASASTDGLLSREHEPAILLRSPGVGHRTVGLGATTDRNSGSPDARLDGAPGDAVSVREGLHRSARRVLTENVTPGMRAGGLLSGTGLDRERSVPRGLVTPEPALHEGRAESARAYVIPSAADLAAFTGHVVSDRILKISRRSWQGHVYNLQTATGWYVANSIIVHNCRCTAVPVTKTWRDLGIDLDEPEPVYPDAREWFGQQPAATQTRIMGKERLARLERGEIDWGQLSQRRVTPGWRDSFGVPPLA